MWYCVGSRRMGAETIDEEEWEGVSKKGERWGQRRGEKGGGGGESAGGWGAGGREQRRQIGKMEVCSQPGRLKMVNRNVTRIV